MMDIIQQKEERLLRKGSALNTLGIIRLASIYNGTLTKEQYTAFIKRNYMVKELDQSLIDRLNDVWKSAPEMLENVKMLDRSSTTADKICIKKLKK